MSDKELFHAAIRDLAAINECLGLDPDDGGAEPIIGAIEELKTQNNEVLDLLALMFDAYEEGPDCYEEPEDCSGHIGKAIHLDNEAFQRIADILNEHRPRNIGVVTPNAGVKR